MPAIPQSLRRVSGMDRALDVTAGGLLLAALLAIAPHFPGSLPALLSFCAMSVGLLWLALRLRPSVFTMTLALFLTLGFLLKALAHFGFSAVLIEPIGQFDGTPGAWDRALFLASTGLLGVAIGVGLARFLPTFPHASHPRSMQVRPGLLMALLYFGLGLSLAVYLLNHHAHIIRIGYPLGIPLHPYLYAILAFTITWGAVLACATVAQWAEETGKAPPSAVILVASLLGFLASYTMGSRSQFLLYGLAAVFALASRPAIRTYYARRPLRLLPPLGFALLLFIVSLGLVSIERNLAFRPDPVPAVTQPAPAGLPTAPPATALTEQVERVLDGDRLTSILLEIRNLAIMRWVGLEGVMTIAGAGDMLSPDLLAQALVEAPDAGVHGLYQRMAGSAYASHSYFTFLTLPGPIGVAGFGGSALLVFTAMLALTLAGHVLEWLGALLVRTHATIAVTGVSLAYLTVQMGFPWTLMVFYVELAGALIALGCLRWLLNRNLVRTGAR